MKDDRVDRCYNRTWMNLYAAKSFGNFKMLPRVLLEAYIEIGLTKFKIQ